MVTSRQHYTEVFGILHAFTLGTVLLVGACLAWPVQMLPLSSLNTPKADSALWIAEGVLYLLLSFLFARNLVGTIAGVVLGFVTRIAASALIFLLVPTNYSELFAFGGGRGLFHALAVIIAVLALAVSFRTLLANFSLSRLTAPAKGGGKTRFAFENRPLPSAAKPQATAKVPLVLPLEGETQTANGEPATHLYPPEDFTTILPRDDAIGTVTIPAAVILESVPEAKSILNPGYKINIRMSYIVPQLPRATVWLTWRQIFEKGAPPMPNVDTAKLEPEFQNRWVRIHARHYVTQVPRDYFQTKNPTPAWLKLPAVEQEADISFTP